MSVAAERDFDAWRLFPFALSASISVCTGRVMSSSMSPSCPSRVQSNSLRGLHCRNRFVSGNTERMAVMRQ